MRFLTGNDDELLQWAIARMPGHDISGIGPFRCMGFMVGDTLEAVAVYSGWNERANSMELSMVAVSPRWATKSAIRALLGVPFHQYGINRLWCTTRPDNTRALRIAARIGFVAEGVMRDYFGYGMNAVMLGMLHSDWRSHEFFVRQNPQSPRSA